MKLIIASNNTHKLIEIKAILGDHFGEILSMREAGIPYVYQSAYDLTYSFLTQLLKE